MYTYKATIVRVIDGDTIEVMLDLGFNTHRVEKIRVVGEGNKYFNTPETRLGKDTTPQQKELGLEAKLVAGQVLYKGRGVVVHTYKDSKGKYGRFLGAIELENGTDYASNMVRANYGKFKDEA